VILFEHILIQALFVVVENLMAGVKDKLDGWRQTNVF
jgi:hypothetical protein